jgi:16S rRNA (guanine966-N2)-methyltransferase
LRIISGTHRGKKITAPLSLPVRPTTDRAKEGLFNSLGHRFDFSKLRVLDLFSGTGNLSYECASRSAAEIVAVDLHKGACNFISKTANELGFPIAVQCKDVFEFLNRPNHHHFDLILGDPPYDIGTDKYITIINAVFSHPTLLSEGGILILEHASSDSLESHPNFTQKKKYGSSTFSWFEKKAGHKPDSV